MKTVCDEHERVLEQPSFADLCELLYKTSMSIIVCVWGGGGGVHVHVQARSSHILLSADLRKLT